MNKPPASPPPRVATPRERLLATLEAGQAMSLLDLSRAAGISERDIPAHLEHLERSLRRAGRRLHTEPPRCLDCGFAFPGRRRTTRPGRCPRCRSSHLASPRVRLLERGERP